MAILASTTSIAGSSNRGRRTISGDQRKILIPFSYAPSSSGTGQANQFDLVLTRRAATSVLLLPLLFPSQSAASATVGGTDLEPYVDEVEGFAVLRPSSWAKVDKAGATALFEDGSNSVGIVVTPVRLSSLKDFGTPEFVADKLLQAERKKESTKWAEMVSFRERSGQDGDMSVYEIEYSVDSTRGGKKRVFSAAFVHSKKLYLLNISHSDSAEKPLDAETRLTLEKILHSFDVETSKTALR